MDFELDVNEVVPAFRPTPAHVNDFRWFFCTIGRTPKMRRFTPADARRWKAIDRCLDNRGRALCEFYTNPEQFIEPLLAAAEKTGERWSHGDDLWGSSGSVK